MKTEYSSSQAFACFIHPLPYRQYKLITLKLTINQIAFVELKKNYRALADEINSL
ncbi:MAG: hypothetical protein IPH18_18300 [Chitinophagaceae bacterium]|nr:hypothetical protein [Chitinophagaceae bacterium]